MVLKSKRRGRQGRHATNAESSSCSSLDVLFVFIVANEHQLPRQCAQLILCATNLNIHIRIQDHQCRSIISLEKKSV
jgi:hypothetical protein